MAADHPEDSASLDLSSAVRGLRSVTTSAAEKATDVAKETAYTAVGLGVLAYQRLQVRRREFERAMRNSSAD